jgi:hypothetical protein
MWYEMKRTEYFGWSKSAVETLKTLREKGHKWPVIAGRLSAMYDMAVTPNACRSKYDRSLKWKHDPTKSKEDLDLSPLFRKAPPAIREEMIKEEISQYSFIRFHYVPYNATPEEERQALIDHWQGFVDFQSEIHDLSYEEIQAVKSHEPPTWFKNWALGFQIWRPGIPTSV